MKFFLVSLFLIADLSQANEILNIFEKRKNFKKKSSLNLSQRFQVKDELVESIEESFKKASKKQKLFFRYLKEQRFKECLLNWDDNFLNSWFEKTSTGKALKAYILMRSGFYELGLRKMFQIKAVHRINPLLKERIKLTLRQEHPVWKKAYLPWNSSWNSVFSNKIKSNMFASPIYSGVRGKKLFQYIQRTLPNTKERSLLQWRMAVDYYEAGELKKASEILSFLIREKNSFVSKALIHLTVARFLYEKSLFKDALHYYNKIGKSSVHWFSAQEEKVWVYIRMNQVKKALETISSMNSDSLKYFVSPEAVFLNSFLNLKVCNYLESYKSSLNFKNRYSKKVKVLSSLITKDKVFTESYIKAKKKSNFKFSSEDHHSFNHYPIESLKSIYLDDLVKKLIYVEKEFLSFEESFKNKMNKKAFKKFQSQYLSQTKKIKNSIASHLKTLAKQEIDQISKATNKLHVVESEVLTQLFKLKENLKNNRFKLINRVRLSTDKYDLVFPLGGESWLDEISNHRAGVRDCKFSSKEKKI